MYRPVVQDVLQAAVIFLAELLVSDAPTSVSAIAEVTAWIDDRLDLAYHRSFVRVNQLILRHELRSARGRDVDGNSGAKKSHTVAKRTNKFDKRGSRSIPVDIRRALPKQVGRSSTFDFCLLKVAEVKMALMRYWWQPGKGEAQIKQTQDSSVTRNQAPPWRGGTRIKWLLR
ncbi:hypothetical protein GQ600_24384 [Phytophthora cactorum]|nr:hypothetical protein GQ600_24384 [Phytophthora cactorum]